MFQITQVALEYRNCHADQVVERLLQHLRRADAPPFPPLAREPPARLCCTSVLLPPGRAAPGAPRVCELCVSRPAPRCSSSQAAAALDSFYLKEQTFSPGAPHGFACSNFLSSYSPFSSYSACCRAVGRAVTGCRDVASGRAASEAPALAFSPLEKKCEAHGPGSVPHIEENSWLFPEMGASSTRFTGLSCRTNKTLNIYLLDSNLFWLYAERLGAPSAARVKEFAAIVDVKEESHYVLDPKQALMKFTLGTAGT